MTERDIAGDVLFLIDQYKKLDTAEMIACQVALTRLATTVLVDLHRCADALEAIAGCVGDTPDHLPTFRSTP